MQPLKPCPFCGGLPYHELTVTEEVIRCTICNARLHFPTDRNCAIQRPGAAEQWNTRAPMRESSGDSETIRCMSVVLENLAIELGIPEEERGNPDALFDVIEGYKEALEDKRRLVRELDVALNGSGAAKQASLCDIVAQVKGMGWKPIETAPTDGREILVGNDGSISGVKPWCTVARWDFEKEGFWELNNHPTDYWGDKLEVTHWKPHPLPPQRNEIEGGES